MAFAEVYYPRDNDQTQLALWPDNDELTMTGDNFCDQFVTFDPEDTTTLGGAILDDPPSPSILLESLHNELSNSSSFPLGPPSDEFHPEAPATTSRQQTSATQGAGLKSLANFDAGALSLSTRDPVLGTGSISDSELLRLEGISLKSSPQRKSVTAPSSPRKQNPLAGSFHGSIRGAANRAPPIDPDQFQSINMANLDTLLDDPQSGLEFFDLNYNEFGDPSIQIKQEPVDEHGLPLTPPLTGRIPNERHNSSSGFVTGHLDDPFCDGSLNAAMPIRSAKRHNMHTPMSTPLQGHHAMTPLNTNVDGFRRPQKAYRSTSSAKWPTEGILTDVGYNEDPTMWSAAPSSAMYVGDSSGSSNIPSPSWWSDLVQNGEMAHAEPAPHNNRGTTNGHGVVLSNVTHNLSMHNQQADMPYEYNADLSGLMIHMPQPRAPQASVLNSNLNKHVLGTPNMSSSSSHYHTPTMTRTRPSHSQYTNGSSNGKAYGHSEKRPRPRAPSSGARYHGAQTSPRKLRNSMSLGYLREESQSPSPMPRQHQHQHRHDRHGHHHPPTAPHPHPLPPSNGPHSINHQERRQHRSSSLTMRKQRSFSRRESSRTSSASFAGSPTRGASNGSSAGGGGGGGGGGSGGGGGGGLGGLDFVNFTPSDSSVLMTGVAPSGSSKTKARREKEAQEKAKQLSDLAFKVVEAAGGDVTKLIGDFVI